LRARATGEEGEGLFVRTDVDVLRGDLLSEEAETTLSLERGSVRGTERRGRGRTHLVASADLGDVGALERVDVGVELQEKGSGEHSGMIERKSKPTHVFELNSLQLAECFNGGMSDVDRAEEL
jgi:hypothetical protein